MKLSFSLITPKVCVFVFILISAGAACSDDGEHIDLPEQWPWRGVSMGFPEATPADIERFHSELNINAVRLQLKVRKEAKRSGRSASDVLDESLKWTDAMLDECARLGIVAIVNISQVPLDPNIGISQTSQEFWAEEANLDETLELIDKVVTYFDIRGDELAAFDFISEPVIADRGRAKRPEQWPSLAQKIVDLITKRERPRWAVIASGPWGMPTGFRDFSGVEGDKVIYGSHMYLPHAFTHQGVRKNPLGVTYPGYVKIKRWDKQELTNALEPLKQFQRQRRAPVLIGEFGAVRWAQGSEAYLQDLVSLFEESGWSWLYFSGTGWHGWNPDFGTDYWKGSANDQNDNSHGVEGTRSVRWNTLRRIFAVQENTKESGPE